MCRLLFSWKPQKRYASFVVRASSCEILLLITQASLPVNERDVHPEIFIRRITILLLHRKPWITHSHGMVCWSLRGVWSLFVLSCRMLQRCLMWFSHGRGDDVGPLVTI